jgi:radical SAM protein with 4Fe4S-binding SPASM domain
MNRKPTTLPFRYALRKLVARSIRGIPYRRTTHTDGHPREIVLGLHNQCTRRCSFCRFGLPEYAQELRHFMPDETILRIIDDLKSAGYRGSIGIGRYCEPLMDMRLEAVLGIMSAELSDCELHVLTNGDPATRERLEAICRIPTLTKILVSLYDGEEQLARWKDMIRGCSGDVQAKVKLIPKFSFEDFHVVNKIGELAIKQAYELKEWGRSAEPGLLCTEPFRRMMINHDGTVPMCCNILDFTREDQVMGNVNGESILEIWRGEKFSAIRARMANGGLQSIEACGQCDDYRFCVVIRVPKAAAGTIAYYRRVQP